jgi:hypothetical protein
MSFASLGHHLGRGSCLFAADRAIFIRIETFEHFGRIMAGRKLCPRQKPVLVGVQSCHHFGGTGFGTLGHLGDLHRGQLIRAHQAIAIGIRRLDLCGAVGLDLGDRNLAILVRVQCVKHDQRRATAIGRTVLGKGRADDSGTYRAHQDRANHHVSFKHFLLSKHFTAGISVRP